MWALLGVEIALLVGGLAYVGYYFIFELAFGQTVGKMLTGTKVVGVDGEKPTVPALIGRSLARYIPFEPLSFLFYGSYPTKGWHDRVSGTLVVPKHLSPEQVRSIDPEKLGKGGVGGIIVAIIVIGFFAVAVLGIVIALVMAALSDARQAGEQKVQESQLSTASSSTPLSPEVLSVIRAEAESYDVPQDAGDGIRIDRVFVDRTTSALTFEYTFTDKVADDFDLENFKILLTGELRSGFCENTPELAYYRDNGVTLAWVYYDKNGEHLATVSSLPGWCE